MTGTIRQISSSGTQH